MSTPCGSPCNPCTGLVGCGCIECTPGVSDPNCVRYKLDPAPWSKRQAMICGAARDYLYSISPHAKQFVVTPALNENTILKVVWDGYKYAWGDNDEINFPPEAAEAVAAYVMAKVARNIDKNLTLSQSYDQEYARLRLALFRDFREALIPDGQDEEYDGVNLPPGTNGGAVNAGITSWALLAAVPTNFITTGTTILWTESATGLLRATQLRAGTDATSTPDGVQRPDDYSATNERVWYLVGGS
jgi:hypothetical protein